MKHALDITPKARWSTPTPRALAGAALLAGGVLMVLELCVIVATDGRVIDTGASVVFFLLGVAALVVGMAAAGVAVAGSRRRAVRALAGGVGAVAFFAGYAVLDMIAKAVCSRDGYWRDELAILFTAVLALAGAAFAARPTGVSLPPTPPGESASGAARAT